MGEAIYTTRVRSTSGVTTYPTGVVGTTPSSIVDCLPLGLTFMLLEHVVQLLWLDIPTMWTIILFGVTSLWMTVKATLPLGPSISDSKTNQWAWAGSHTYGIIAHISFCGILFILLCTPTYLIQILHILKLSVQATILTSQFWKYSFLYFIIDYELYVQKCYDIPQRLTDQLRI